jgi:hypothetical protein
MGTETGTFVLSWSQVELDGHWAAPLALLRVGATWLWTGDAIRVDGPAGVLDLGAAGQGGDLRRRAALAVRRLLGEAGVFRPGDRGIEPDTDREHAVTLTDGRRAWTLTLLTLGTGRPPLLLAHGSLPPRHVELWVVSHGAWDEPAAPAAPAGGVICFTPGTLIRTADGTRPVEALREGDRVQTKDDGEAEILWMASRRITGARLHVMPHLAPVRLRAGALDQGVPDAGLLVSPDHRLVLRGPRARDLFCTEEVLVAARDLVDDRSVTVERPREVTYIHLLLPHHGIVFANGVETESFHPASAALASLDEADRARLLSRLPGSADPQDYGPYARRVLARSEAAILRAEAA